MVRRRRSKNNCIRGLFYTYAIAIFSIRVGGEVLSLGFWLHQEHSWFAVSIFLDLSKPGATLHVKAWHGCTGHRMLLEPERNCGLGMDALVTVCSWNPSAIKALACSQNPSESTPAPKRMNKNEDGMRVE